MSELKVRNLKFGDTYKMADILVKLGVFSNLRTIIGVFFNNQATAEKVKDNKKVTKEDAQQILTQADVGNVVGDFVESLLSNWSKASKELNTFFGSLVGLSAKEFEALDFDEAYDVIEQFFKNPKLKSFLQRVFNSQMEQ